MTDEDKDLDKDLDEDLEDNTDDSGSDDSAPPDDQKPEDNSGKRINDLMSRAQKAEARAAKAEAALAKFSGEGKGDQGGDVADSKPNDEFVEFARENARNTLFGSDPRLAAYGLKAESITGNTISEMRESFQAQKKLIDGIESAARQKVLREHGLDPEVSTGAASEKAPDFASMSQEEFEKFLNARDNRTY